MRPVWYTLPLCTSLSSWDERRQIPISIALCILLQQSFLGSYSSPGQIWARMFWCVLLLHTSTASWYDQGSLVLSLEQMRIRTCLLIFCNLQQAFTTIHRYSDRKQARAISLTNCCFAVLCYEWRLTITLMPVTFRGVSKTPL